MEHIARKDAFELLKKYNKDPFHIQHARQLILKRSKVNPVQSWFLNSKMGRHRHSRLILTFRNRRYPIQEILRQTEQTALRKRVEAVL